MDSQYTGNSIKKLKRLSRECKSTTSTTKDTFAVIANTSFIISECSLPLSSDAREIITSTCAFVMADRLVLVGLSVTVINKSNHSNGYVF